MASGEDDVTVISNSSSGAMRMSRFPVGLATSVPSGMLSMSLKYARELSLVVEHDASSMVNAAMAR